MPARADMPARAVVPVRAVMPVRTDIRSAEIFRTLTISSADPPGGRPGEAAPRPAKAASVPREIPGGDMRARTQLRKSTGGGEGRRHTEASETVRPEK